MFVAGGFIQAGNVPSYIFTKWDGLNWHDLSCPYRNISETIECYNSKFYIGGNILDSIGNNVDIISWDGSAFSIVGGGIHGSISSVDALCVYNGKLYVGGYFSTTNGNAGNNIMAWNGTSWEDVGGGTDHEVRCMSVHNNELYVGGYFTHAGGILTNHLAKWNGIFWTTATPAIIINKDI